MYDDKHHFGKERILKDLNNIHIRNKVQKVDKYLKTYHLCGINRTDNQLPVDNLQPILAPLQPMYTTFLDFVVELPTVPSKDIFWTIDGFDVFDSFFTNICKVSKRKLLILNNKRYSIED